MGKIGKPRGNSWKAINKIREYRKYQNRAVNIQVSIAIL